MAGSGVFLSALLLASIAILALNAAAAPCERIECANARCSCPLEPRIDIIPSSAVPQGSAYTVRIGLSSTFPDAHDVPVRIDDASLNVSLKTTLTLAPYESRVSDFIIPVGCAPSGEQNLTVTIAGERQQRTVRIVENADGCMHPATALVDIQPWIDVRRSEEASYPIRIVNLQTTALTYRAELQAGAAVATYRFEPSPEFTIAPGGAQQLLLHVRASDDAQPGRNDLFLHLNGTQSQELPLTLRVIAPQRATLSDGAHRFLRIALSVLGLLLILAAILFMRPRRPQREEPSAPYTYY